MLALSFTFLAGRYHATPWDRHVNEGAVAWPPEPWRILRGLIATWHHKVKYTGKYDETTLQGLIDTLSCELPEYHLPAASHSHTRHYMPKDHYKGKFDAKNASLVFDAFAAVGRNDPLTVTWPGLELRDEQRHLLDDLLAVMGYLGRAESWVEARRISDVPERNCWHGTDALDTATGELRGETVSLYAPLPPAQYAELRQHFLPDKKAIKKLGKTLPESLLDALSVDTADLRKQGWNQPPAAHKVSYLRPVDALEPRRLVEKLRPPVATTASFILVGKPLPRVEDSLHIGELVRMAVMGQAKRIFGEDNIPSIFSGHGLPRGNRHQHAFYLPWDSNGDGRLDRILVHVPAGMDAMQQQIFAKLRRIWSYSGSKWRLALEGLGKAEAGCALTGESTVWESATPYMHPWHTKKRFGIEDQIRRECEERHLPAPNNMTALEQVDVGSRKRHPIHFKRFRNRKGLTQPDRQGSFWRLTFPEPLRGPLALGFACHFGLGLFRPVPLADALARMPDVGQDSDFERR